jgi:glycosyltransferase involved in cell wall biosynthesis
MNAKKTQVIAFDARYVNDQYHGIGRHAYNLLDALTRFDAHRRYLAFYNPDYPNSRFSMEALKARANIELRPIRLPLYSPQEQIVWPLLLAQEGVDLFHSPYVLLPLLAPVKSLITVHDLIFERHPEYRTKGYLQKFYRPIMQINIKRASSILTVSESTARDIQEYYHSSRASIQVIGNAIDPIFKREHIQQRLTEVRERYGLPERFILTVGAGRPHKNIETLVEAFAHLDPSLAVTLVIGGKHDPRFPDSVGASIDTHDIGQRVVRLGMIQEADLPVIYSLATLFVFPSLVEGFGLPPLEAMACGTPVIASTSSAVSEVVGDAALTFDALNIQQLTTALNKALRDTTLRNTLTSRGEERIKAFTWERVAKATIEAYSSIEVKDVKKLHPVTS